MKKAEFITSGIDSEVKILADVKRLSPHKKHGVNKQTDRYKDYTASLISDTNIFLSNVPLDIIPYLKSWLILMIESSYSALDSPSDIGGIQASILTRTVVATMINKLDEVYEERVKIENDIQETNLESVDLEST